MKYILYKNRDIVNEMKIWWRDDDSFEVNDNFKKLIEFHKRVKLNVYLSVIPSKINKQFIEFVNNIDGIFVFLHGYAHINHSNDIAILNEYPESRDIDQVSHEISESVKILNTNFPSKYLPVFVPPWEHYSNKLLTILPNYGINIISLSGHVEELPKWLLDLNTHITFHTYKNINPDRYIANHKNLLSLCKEFITAAKNHRFKDRIGFMTHHKDMTSEDWENYGFLLSELNKRGCKALSNNEITIILNEAN